MNIIKIETLIYVNHDIVSIVNKRSDQTKTMSIEIVHRMAYTYNPNPTLKTANAKKERKKNFL